MSRSKRTAVPSMAVRPVALFHSIPFGGYGAPRRRHRLRQRNRQRKIPQVAPGGWQRRVDDPDLAPPTHIRPTTATASRWMRYFFPTDSVWREGRMTLEVVVAARQD
uniref:Uncharacterized protein n=1 Tax=Oryza meridionalis TaxID=40149 RepID=A0A0E0DI80_9ORYZ